MSGHEFSVDLGHLDLVTIRIRAFAEYLDDNLSELDTLAGQQMASWSGDAASAYVRAHQVWVNAAREVHEGMQSIESAARAARGNYGNASKVNTRMFDV